MPQDATIQLTGPSVEPSPALLNSALTTVKAEFSPGAPRAAQQPKTLAVDPADIVEIEFEDSQRVWMRADDYRDRFAVKSRDGGPTLEIPAVIEPLPGRQLDRGVAMQLAVKALRVLGVNLGAEKSAEAIAQRIEKGRRGVVRCTGAADGLRLEDLAAVPESSDPYLVLLHGTGSSTAGSFAELWNHSEWTALVKSYPGRVIALDHATLTKSPAENALELASKLPAKARLHLLSHSRGGLVGELLCRSSLAKPFSAQELDIFDAAGQQRKDLEALAAAFSGKQIQVERFVRVACPTLGTTLASGRLDRWFSVAASACSGAAAATMAGAFLKEMADFIAAVVHERTDPKTLPGLEAMMPESPFIQLVNWPTTQLSGDLAVISGDIEKDTWAARLLVWMTDRFYSSDHDLVVNTPSMYGGVRRLGQSVKSFHKGPEVNHFRYFTNDSSARRITAALTGDLTGFDPLTKPSIEIAREAARPSAAPRPVVVLLPGIMGSELTAGNDHVWLDIPDIAFGGFSKLDIKAKDIRPTQPMPSSYGEIVRFLADTHRVVPFPFDWRLPVEKEADRLAKVLAAEFEAARAANQPVRLLAHSMGGLVARTMIARNPALWRDICANPGARLVMLGTPNGGSHSITELLVARSSTLKQLSLVDLRHNKRGLLEIISRFPGVLAMLPVDSAEDYFAAATWNKFQAGDNQAKDWLTPDAADLKAARDFRALLDKSPIDPARMVYLAGHSDSTLVAMKLQDGGIKFFATQQGDGRVPWATGIPAGVPTYYCETSHGDLAANPHLFGAIHDMLESGQTAQLAKTPPVSRAAATLFEMPPAENEMYPTRDGLAAAAIGSRGETTEPVKTVPPINVRIIHGHLQYATHPITVGHYSGDTIISAEYHVDLALGGALRRKHALGLYPGAIGENAVFFNHAEQACPKGAIVVGLGDVGSLSASLLSRAFTRAMLEFVVERAQCSCKQSSDNTGIGVSPLLIGTGAGGVSVNDCIFALIRGTVQANAALEAAASNLRITEIEFVEIFEDRALAAAAALNQLQESPHRDAFNFNGRVETVDGARYRVNMEEPPGWWQRLQIRGKSTDPGVELDGELRFVSVTRRARNEMKVLATQRRLVNQFIEKSISTTRDNREVAKTLFELLLPNELKEQSPDQDDLVLMVDEESARYPWEMLQDPYSGDGPYVVKHGVIRQLESASYRLRPHTTREKTALVIGDPVSKFPELPGAQEEADLVARVLGDHEFGDGEALTRPNARDLMRALFRKPYRVLHLAGHGVYEYVPDGSKPGTKPVTGMIIGDDMVLSPNEIEQMRMVPELVFINCCHLGRIESRPENAIAANVATQFIRIGVRAVVAAGWAVDDRAANTFARVFYEQMLSGKPFGRAVHTARQATYDQHGATNTWGAYQCYGDQDYKLTDSSSSKSDKDLRFANVSEARVEIDTLAARFSSGAATAADKEALDKLAAYVDKAGWFKNGAMLSSLARAYRDGGFRADALRYFKQALNTEDGGGSLKDLEQVWNLEVRVAVETAAADPKQRAEGLATIGRCIQQLEAIVDGQEYVSGTGERLAILAGAHKRQAMLCDGAAERVAALECMAKRYQQAFDRIGKRYHHLMWFTAEVVLDWYRPARSKKAPQRIDGFDAELSRLAADLSTGCGTSQWDIIMSADAALVQALAAGKIDAEKLGELYRNRKARVSYGAFASVPENIDFLIEMARKRELKSALTRLRQAIA